MKALNPGDTVNLTRDVRAAVVPAGEIVTLVKGEPATVTQALGGNYTVVVHGNMFRIDRRDADALGLEVTPDPAGDGAAAGEAEINDPEELEQRIWAAMRNCYDPEIPVNLVDLGLIYDCVIDPLPEGGHRVSIKMTLTAPGCGMGNAIAADVESRVREVPGVREVEVALVWDPPWNQEMMSEAAKLQLGFL